MYRTSKKNRATYVYTSVTGAEITLQPGVDGVTVADIAALYRADDDECNNEEQQHRSGRKIVTKIESLEEIDPDFAWVRDNAPLPDEAAVSADEARILRKAIALLPDKQAKAVTAVWLDGIAMKKHSTKTAIRQIDSSKLHLDDYQRPLDEMRVAKIVKEFNPDLVNYVKCSQRTNGDLYIFDGQHTRAALVRKNGNKPVPVECRIYEFVGLSDAERYEVEARLFEKQNGLSKQVTLGSKLNSEYKRGEARAVEFHKDSNISGLTMNFSRGAGHGSIRCVREALRAWELLGGELYQDMLNIIVEAWGLGEDGLRGEVIGGLSIFMNTHKGEYDRKRLVKKLAAINPMEIVRDGNLSTEQSKKKYARQIANVYNKGTKFQLYGI